MTRNVIDHVGILVADFAPIRALLNGQLGLEIGQPEVEAELGLEILWVDAEGVTLEFIRPTRSDTAAAELIRQGAAGVHHLGVRVDDIDGTMQRLKDAGIALVDQVARPGAHGSRIAFVEASEASGTRIELVEARDSERKPGADY